MRSKHLKNLIPRLRLSTWVIVGITSSSSAPLSAQTTGSQSATLPRVAMDQYLSRLSQFGASGAVLVMRNGRVMYDRGFGWANRARRTPMSTAIGVDIASMSKTLTAVAILQLEERGLLKRSDSLAKYFDSVPTDKRAITIEQLITHRSGLPSFFVEGNDFTRLTRQHALDSIMVTKLEFAPGTGEEYSDAGYVLLAILLERRTGGTLEAFLAREQFLPAGLTRTYSYGSTALRTATDIAHGYIDTRDAGSAATYVPNTDYWVVKGAGGIVSTVRDIALWETALRRGKFIGAKSLAVLLGANANDSSAALIGPPERLPSGQRGWIRTGAQDFGFSAGAIRYAHDSTVVVVALNRQPPDMDISYLRNRILMDVDHFVSGTAPVLPPAGAAIPSTMDAVTGTYVLPDSSRLIVTRAGENIVVTPDGPLAVELLAYPSDTVGRAFRLALAAKATNALVQLCQGNASPLRAAMARPSERIETYLKSTACGDSTKRVHVVGTVPHWWSRVPTKAPATLIEIVSPERTTRMRFEWDGDRVSAVGGGGIVPPMVPFVATRVPSEFAGYHLGIASPVRLVWNTRGAERDQIVLGAGAEGTFIARRLAPARQ